MVSLVWQRAAGLVGAAKESEAGIQECLLPMTLILVIIYWHLPHINDLNSIALGYNALQWNGTVIPTFIPTNCQMHTGNSQEA